MKVGVATASHQFARTLGGTIGVGVFGGLVTSGLLGRLEKVSTSFPPALMEQLRVKTKLSTSQEKSIVRK